MTVLARQDRPPEPGPRQEILRLRANQMATLWVLSSNLEGLWTHWDAARNCSKPCTRGVDERGNAIKCPACEDMLPRRWKGYLYCRDHDRKKQCFVELTPASATSLYAQVGEDIDLRGHKLKVQRGKGDKARLLLTALGQFDLGPVAPPAESVIQTLLALWKLGKPEVERPNDVDESPNF